MSNVDSQKHSKEFSDVDAHVNFPEIEEQVLKYWNRHKIFEKSLDKTRDGKRYVFYEGPPTANGQPGIHHVLARSFKDLFPRYHTMRGEFCLRKGGWDTHGLPVELQVEKELGISGKKDIENLVPGDKRASIAKFNRLCRESVFRYVQDWQDLTERMGFWIDIKNAYATLTNDYIESCWAILKKFYDDGFLSRDYKVTPYCPRCGTPLSSHELAMGYEDVVDPSVYVKFKIQGEDDTYFLVWTTTPWTLPANVALAVLPKARYVKVQYAGEYLILAKKLIDLIPDAPKVIQEFDGQDLVGKRYEPLFNFHDFGKKAYKIYPADFVSLEEGTGVVHTAVMYGADDFELGKKYDLPKYHLVDKEGKFKTEVDRWAGRFVKEVDSEIIDDLRARQLLFKAGTITHSYPLCWRCKTPLIYYALKSWFIKTTKKKEKILEENRKTNWIPSHMREGRMGNWLENMVDWAISRLRYWGTPLPIWKCEQCGKERCIGSIQELSEFTDKEINDDFDLHRPYIDELIGKCSNCDGKMVRYKELVDVWFDSGAMPFAQWHYPFENKEKIDSRQQFPADFIAEGQDQTRGWFYTLLVISTLFSGQNSYRNVLSLNLVLDKNGKKMSKSVGNVVDPWKMMDNYGADIVRWYFYSSVSVGLPYKFDEKDLQDVSRRFVRILWNSYKFFVTYANIAGWTYNKRSKKNNNLTLLDRWILVRLAETVARVNLGLKKYNATVASRAIEKFVVNDFSNWYIRRSRERVGALASVTDRDVFLTICYDVLVCLTKLLAPFMPFISDEIYRNLTKKPSVHLADYPQPSKHLPDKDLVSKMELARKIVSEGHAIRKQNQIPIRQPLAKLEIVCSDKQLPAAFLQLIKEELNIKQIHWTRKAKSRLAVVLDLNLTPALKEEGKARELIRKIQEARKNKGVSLTERIDLLTPWVPQRSSLQAWIKKKTLVRNLIKGEKLTVVRIGKNG